MSRAQQQQHHVRAVAHRVTGPSPAVLATRTPGDDATAEAWASWHLGVMCGWLLIAFFVGMVSVALALGAAAVLGSFGKTVVNLVTMPLVVYPLVGSMIAGYRWVRCDNARHRGQPAERAEPAAADLRRQLAVSAAAGVLFALVVGVS